MSLKHIAMCNSIVINRTDEATYWGHAVHWDVAGICCIFDRSCRRHSAPASIGCRGLCVVDSNLQTWSMVHYEGYYEYLVIGFTVWNLVFP